MSKIFDVYDELRDAQLELQIAQQNFNNADPVFIDVAVEELQIAEARVGIVVRKAKLLRGGESA